MIEFKDITIEDREILNPYLLKNPYGNCDFSFTNIFIWRRTYQTKYAIVDGFLVLLSRGQNFLMPLGEGDLKAVIGKLIDHAKEKGIPFRMVAITPQMEQELNEALKEQLVYLENRDWSDYIYLTQDLIYLKGKKYHSKRNHINKFSADYDFEFIELTKDDIPACKKMHKLWCEENYSVDDEEEMGEVFAVRQALDHFEELGLQGGAIVVDGEMVAFTLGQPVNADTFDIIIEKALSEYATAYTVINRCFAHRKCSRYTYINREEDLGLDGLRRAKLSYHPVCILDKKIAVLKEQQEREAK